MKDIHHLRQTFDEVATLYHAARPRYPEALFTTLVDKTGLSAGAEILEIGCGTGLATLPMAQRGFQVTAIEPGASMAAVAAAELAEYKNVQIRNSTFESADCTPESFDLIYAATAFHWIDPAVKYAKPHQLLKKNGYLAIIHTHHVSDEQGDEFFFGSMPVYERYGFLDRPEPRLPEQADIQPEETDGRLFRNMHFERFPLIISYTAAQYVNLLNTFSNHLAADKHTQRLFYRDIAGLIDEAYDGRIVKHFAMSLTILQKTDTPQL